MKIFEKSGKMFFPEPNLATITPRHEVADGSVLIEHLYCPNGHSLMEKEGSLFGRSGIVLLCQGDKMSQVVTLSPFFGSSKKQFEEEFYEGEEMVIRCPECAQELPTLAPHDCQEGAKFVAAFLTPDAQMNNCVGICTIWGCYANIFCSYDEIITKIRTESIIPEG